MLADCSVQTAAPAAELTVQPAADPTEEPVNEPAEEPSEVPEAVGNTDAPLYTIEYDAAVFTLTANHSTDT